jgi:raffinose/stachyose/melibiose transport system substrate-binding protein
MRSKLKTGVSLFIAVLLALSLLAGCGNNNGSSATNDSNQTNRPDGNNSTASAPDKKVTLTIETSQEMLTNNPFVNYQPNIDAFEAKYPNITVKFVLDPDTQVQNILQTKIAAGQPSDIIIFSKVAAENELNLEENFIDLSDEPWVSKLTNPSAVRTSSGKIKGFSMKNMIGGMGIVYNQNIFRDLNLPVPKNWEQFLEVCEAIKASGITPIYAPFKDAWTFQMYTTTSWGYYVAMNEPDLWDRLNANEINWSDIPAFEESLNKFHDLYKLGYMQESLLSDDYAAAPQKFQTGKFAMMMGADVTATDLQAKIPEAEFGLFPLPMFEGEEEYLTIGQLDGVFFIPKDAKNIEEAKKFLAFLAEPEQLNAAQEAKSFIPSIDGAEAPAFNPFEEEIYKTYNEPGKTVPEMNIYMKVDLNDLWKYYQEMFAGLKTPNEVLQAWDKKFDELMGEKGIQGF